MAAKLWTLDKGTVDFTIIAFAFWRAGAWRPPFAVFMKNPVIIAIWNDVRWKYEKYWNGFQSRLLLLLSAISAESATSQSQFKAYTRSLQKARGNACKSRLLLFFFFVFLFSTFASYWLKQLRELNAELKNPRSDLLQFFFLYFFEKLCVCLS